ncbi:class A beta-lactamase-related serine hydrolase [Flavobacterium piscinae]|uniref:Class A beta-lactamase-related serine hydrolase n=2 Tax=Flavobacterium piscinae TaxID=2506424 RepID=A0A4Q1KPI2_9FLAO|nr:serine hydrolase domain-containing protein [Flavobacterium piscinae]RXR31485.1 class A beta-lactamase-related serine hydrolase [Flavobacterium piscinae]
MKKITLLFILTFPLFAFAQKSKSERLDSLFTALHQKKAFNGNVLIAEQGNVLFEKSYGLANEATQQKLNTQTVFELASVSKQFTAMGIVLLAKQGKLNYDDKMSKYIPELSFYGDITIRHLLHHTAGLPDYMALFEQHWDKTKFAVNQDIVNLMATHQPAVLFQPNEKYEYSNTGYALLGLIIEKASKKSFPSYLKDNIFSPLQMKNTLVYRSRYAPQKIDNYALGYVQDSVGKKVLTDSFGKSFYTYYLDGIVGDGMVNSTLGDLLLWDRALYTDKLVNAADKALIFNSVKTTKGEETNYGFGWTVNKHEKYGKIVNHSGGWAGYITFIERHLDQDKTIILLQNNESVLTVLPISQVRKILYNEKIENNALKVITLQSEDLDPYLGVYASEGFPLKLTIFKNENTLMTQATGQSAIPMTAHENDTFTFEPANIKLKFNKKQKSVLLQQGKMEVIFQREE